VSSATLRWSHRADAEEATMLRKVLKVLPLVLLFVYLPAHILLTAQPAW
jgi:hypothetical protein